MLCCRSVECVVPCPQIASVRQHHARSQHCQFHLCPHIEQPLLRSQIDCRGPYTRNVKNGASFHADQSITPYPPIKVAVREEVAIDEWRTPLLSIARSIVAAQPKVRITLHADHPKLIQGSRPQYPTAPHPLRNLVPVPFPAGQPSRGNAPLTFLHQSGRCGPKPLKF